MLDKIKSKCILKNIFKKIRKKRKLNIIKYNKRILNRLNITKEDFEMYIRLKDFIYKYKRNIEDLDIKELDLSSKFVYNKEFEDLINIKFEELKN